MEPACCGNRTLTSLFIKQPFIRHLLSAPLPDLCGWKTGDSKIAVSKGLDSVVKRWPCALSFQSAWVRARFKESLLEEILSRGVVCVREGGCASMFQAEGKNRREKWAIVISRWRKQKVYGWPRQERVMRAGRPSIQFLERPSLWATLRNLDFVLQVMRNHQSSEQANDTIRIYTLEVTIAS